MFHVFGCILKNFPENVFWCLVFGKEEGKHKSENTSHNPEKKNKIINDDRTVITIDGAIVISDRNRRRDLAKSRSRSRLGLELELELRLELAISD